MRRYLCDCGFESTNEKESRAHRKPSHCVTRLVVFEGVSESWKRYKAGGFKKYERNVF